MAKTFKGHGLSFMADSPNWHGKPVPKGEETQKAIDELTRQLKPGNGIVQVNRPAAVTPASATKAALPPSPYKVGDAAATREAFGVALEALGGVNSSVVGLDADVKNSTYTDKFGKKFPNRFFENFIAEQNMLGRCRSRRLRKSSFVATFAAFFARA